jgi:hypothetical protein
MRKRISLIIALILVISCVGLFATTSTLIDFDLLQANGDGVDPAKSKTDIPYNQHTKDHGLNQHMRTVLDYSGIAGSNFTEAELLKMRTSLAPGNWEIKLNSSATTVENSSFSKCIEWHTKYVRQLKRLDLTQDQEAPEGYTILGIRIHFPETPYNAWALIKPPFEIPAYEALTTDEKGALLPTDQVDKEGVKYLNGYGVIRNIGVIKYLQVAAYGTQFNNSLSVLLKDQDDVVTEIHMPEYLNFDGWKRVTWANPNYVKDVANRNLYVIPLYPQSDPFIKIYGFRIYRQGDQRGGDFVTYIKDVVVTYDEAKIKREEPINHEEAWGILAANVEATKKREFSKVGQNQILKYLESLKMDPGTYDPNKAAAE